MEKSLTHDQLIERIRTGDMMHPHTPGLREAARQVCRPLVEQMRGKEITYRCRVPWLMKVEQLSVDDEGFEARAIPIQEIREGIFSMDMDGPLTFGSSWELGFASSESLSSFSW